ncbi:MAG: DMT family transporter [Sarcina sp.]
MRKKGFYSGISKGVISAASWGLYTVLSGILLTMKPFNSTVASIVFLAPFVSVFVYDSFSTIWVLIFLTVKGQLKSLGKAFKSKSAKFIVLGGIMGGPVGMTAYYASIRYLGASNTATISAIYPAFGALLASIILKEKVPFRAWIGLLLMIGSIGILGFTGSHGHFNLIGFGFALITVVGWGSECVIAGFGMQNGEISPEHALQIRQFSSSIAYGIVLIPILSGGSLLVSVFSHGITIVMLIAMALAGAISYFCYYGAINTIGATKAMALNIGYSVWAMIFAFFIQGTGITLKMVICAILVIIGSVMVAAPKKDAEFIEDIAA